MPANNGGIRTFKDLKEGRSSSGNNTPTQRSGNQAGGRIQTFRSMREGREGGGGGPRQQDLYAGNGLNMNSRPGAGGDQDAGGGPGGPMERLQQLMRRAQEEGADDLEERNDQGRPSRRGFRLDGTNEDGEEAEDQSMDEVTWNMTIWRNGIETSPDESTGAGRGGSIVEQAIAGRGQFIGIEDERYGQVIESLDRSEAPLWLLNVRPNQRVRLVLFNRQSADYVPPRKTGAARTGIRLNDPGAASLAEPAAEASAAAAAATEPEPEQVAEEEKAPVVPSVPIDGSIPTVVLRLYLPTGSQTVTLNTTFTVGQLYRFVREMLGPVEGDRFELTAGPRPPFAVLDEAGMGHVPIGEHPSLKRGGVVRVKLPQV